MFAPVWVVRYGREDFRGLLYSVRKRDYLRHVISLVETSIWLGKNYGTAELSEYSPPKPDSLVQSTIIFDMEGFSIRHITYKPGV
jgi:metal transporter CNNM